MTEEPSTDLRNITTLKQKQHTVSFLGRAVHIFVYFLRLLNNLAKMSRTISKRLYKLHIFRPAEKKIEVKKR